MTEVSGFLILDADSVYREQMDCICGPWAETSYFAVYDCRE